MQLECEFTFSLKLSSSADGTGETPQCSSPFGSQHTCKSALACLDLQTTLLSPLLNISARHRGTGHSVLHVKERPKDKRKSFLEETETTPHKNTVEILPAGLLAASPDGREQPLGQGSPHTLTAAWPLGEDT